MRLRAAIVLALLAPVVVAAGCGGEETVQPRPETVIGDVGETATGETGTTTETGGGAAEGDPAAGKELFAANGCGSCHTLADAGSTGAVGPNLDESQPDSDLVVERVTNGSGAMPAFGDRLSETQIQDIAAYVVQATQG